MGFQDRRPQFREKNDRFRRDGYERFLAFTTKKTHERYLKRMGFKGTTIDNNAAFVKTV